MGADIRILLGCLMLPLFLMLFERVNFRIKKLIKANKIRKQMIFILLILFTIPFFFVFGININPKLFLLGDYVYEVREKARGLDNIYTGYMSNWIANVLAPIALVYGVFEKKRWMALISILVLVYIFSCYGTKSVFISIPVVLLFSKGTYLKKIKWFLSIVIGLFLLALLLNSDIYGAKMFKSILFVRTFFVPALNNIYFFDFFDDKFIYWSNGFFKHFFEYPFDKAPSYLIGEIYYSSQKDMNANNGFPADAFINFGFWGMLFFSLIITLIFNVFKSLNIPSTFFGVFFLAFFNIISSSLSTVLVTHGLLFLVIISILLLNETDSQK